MTKRHTIPLGVILIATSQILGVWLGGFSGTPLMGGSLVSVAGVVKDDAGKPLRGARVTATVGDRSVSRFTDKAGRYKISGLQPGTYEIAAGGWGLEKKRNTKDLTGDTDLSFSLAPKWDARQISSADWLTALPENEDTQELRATCIKCHNLSWIVRNKGFTAPQWNNLLMNMGGFGDRLYGKWDNSKDRNTLHLSKEQSERIAGILEKYFGPKSPLPTREQVQHPAISDAALRATFREYKAPTKSYIHSIKPDPNGKYVWFTEFDKFSKRLGRFDIAKEEFLEIPLPADGSSTFVIQGGKVWVTAGRKMYEVDAETGKWIEHVPPAAALGDPPGDGGWRTMGQDSAGNVWLSGGLQVTKFDPRTQAFQSFPVPKVKAVPEDYYRNILNVKSDAQKEFGYWTYSLVTDSHDNVWFTAYDVGQIGRVDPRTNEIKMYRIPGALWIKGIEVDQNDNVWLGNFLHAKLDKLDPKTGQVEQYQPPTQYASFYTPVADKKGQVWLSDFSGSQLTRFNPANKEFTEYPLPAPDGMVRFFGLDPKGRVWYVDWDTGRIGVLDPGDASAP